MDSKYDSYSESSGGNGYDNIELRFTPYAAVNLTVDRVFGSESQFGQSLGVNFSDVELEDGALYVDPEKEVYKLFSWKDVAGLSVSESLERGNEPTADDAPEVETKTYVGNEKTYELVAARVPEVTGPDGDIVLEATSKTRDVTVYDDGTIETDEWEDRGGDLVEVGDTITWYNGSEEYGPSASAKSIAETLTEYGSNAVVDEDDLYNWLPDTSGENIMRSDLEDRRLRFFTVTRESENGFTYHDPIFEDIQTDEQVTPNNRETESDAMQDAREADSNGTYPEPVADFVSSGKGLNLTRERAENLLDELLEDSDNSLTEGMLEESGGRDAMIQEVL
jgi:hypothetical protein